MLGIGYGYGIMPYNGAGFMPYMAYDLANENQKHSHINATDIFEDEKHYEINISLAGYVKEDVSVCVEDDRLDIQAIKEIKEHDKYLLKEIPDGEFKRAYTLKNIDVENIKANMSNGLLNIILPKQEAKQDKEVEKREIKL